jgi:fermentation-respiration switch protein FrsA (DUF1100 family)
MFIKCQPSLGEIAMRASRTPGLIDKLYAFFGELAATFWHDLTSAFSPGEWRKTIDALRQAKLRTMSANLMPLIPQLVVFYLVLSPKVAMPLYNKLLFYPMKEGEYGLKAVNGVAKEDCLFPSANGRKLHAWYFPVPQSRGTVLISHGNGGNLTWRVPLFEMFIRNRVSVFAYDYQGYGLSEGSPTVDNICDDGVAAYDYLVEKKKIAPSKLILYGESLGGAVASYTAARKPTGGLILQSTFSSLPHVAGQKFIHLKLYPRFLFPSNTLDNVAVLKNFHPPLMIVHGMKDRIIPESEAELLFQGACEPKKIVRIEGASHNDLLSTFAPQLEGAIAEFADSTLSEHTSAKH